MHLMLAQEGRRDNPGEETHEFGARDWIGSGGTLAPRPAPARTKPTCVATASMNLGDCGHAISREVVQPVRPSGLKSNRSS